MSTRDGFNRFRLTKKVRQLILNWVMVALVVGQTVSPVVSSVYAEDTGVGIEVVDVAPIEENEVVEPITEVADDSDKALNVEIEEPKTAEELSENANANDSPAEETTTSEDEVKVPNDFDEVDWDSIESLRKALENPNFPFWTVEEAHERAEVNGAIYINIERKTREGFEYRIATLSGTVLRAVGETPVAVHTWGVVIDDPNTAIGNDGVLALNFVDYMTLGGYAVWCVEPNAKYPHRVTPRITQSGTTNLRTLLGEAKAQKIAAVITAATGGNPSARPSNATYLSTQMMIWRVIANRALNDNSLVRFQGEDMAETNRLMGIADELLKPMSFNPTSLTMNIGESRTVNVTNYAGMKLKSTGGISVRDNGGGTITITAVSEGAGAVVASKGTLDLASNNTYVFNGAQDLTNAQYNDPDRTAVTVNVLKPKGRVKLVKTMEPNRDVTESASGVEFRLTRRKNGAVVGTVTATIGADGTWTSPEWDADEVIEIVETRTKGLYKLAGTISNATIVGGQTVTVNVSNRVETGSFKIVKRSRNITKKRLIQLDRKY